MSEPTWVPGFLGRIMSADGTPAGTCFQVADGVLVTAWHVLVQVGAQGADASVRIEPLSAAAGEGGFDAVVKRLDEAHDLAVLTSDTGGLVSSVAGLATSADINTAIVATGVPKVIDPSHEYTIMDAPGSWSGGVERDGLSWGQLTCNSVTPGMSGTAVRRLSDGMVLGVVSGRLNVQGNWLSDKVWVARTVDLLPLLEGVADPVVARRDALMQAVEAVLSIDEHHVSFSCGGTTTSEPHGGVPYALVEAMERLGRQRHVMAQVYRGGAAPAADTDAGVLHEVGQLLAESYVKGAVSERLSAALRQVRAYHQTLRLGVRVAGVMAKLPWEALHLPGGGIAGLDPLVVMYRVAMRGVPVVPAAGPLRILVAISAPLEGGGAVLDYEQELRNVVAAVRGARTSANAHVDVVQFATTDEISQALRVLKETGRSPHVLHLSGHGRPGHFAFEDDDGDARPLSAAEFVREAIPPGLMPPVVSLAACHTDAETAAGDPSFAAGLLERGAAVIISTETAITDSYATRVFAQVYHRLAEGDGDVPEAVSAARFRVQQELARSASDRDREMAGLGEWAVLRVIAPVGATRLVDRDLEPVPPSPSPRQKNMLGRGSGQVIGHVVGRRREQRHWPRQLMSDSIAGLVVYGIGGIGKTTTADEVTARILERQGAMVLTLVHGELTGEALVEQIVRSAHSHYQRRPSTIPAARASLAAALEPRSSWRQQVRDLYDFLENDRSTMLVVLDNFEDNLAGTFVEDRQIKSAELGEVLAELANAGGGRIKLLITSRYRFVLPDLAHLSFAFEQLGPLSSAETMKLAWSLPRLDRLRIEDLELVWRAVGGHPRSLEYLDALLGGGVGRFPDISRRLIRTVRTRLGSDDSAAIAAYLRSHTHLDAALAETVTLTADDILLEQLLGDLAQVPGATRLLYGAAPYRRPVDDNALMFQLADEDPALEAADHRRRTGVQAELTGLLAGAGVSLNPIDFDAMPATLRSQVDSLLPSLRPQAPVHLAVRDLGDMTRACAATSLLAYVAPGAAFVHRSTATAIDNHLRQSGQTTLVIDSHLRAAAYWRWRVRVWPQPEREDARDLVEVHHHLNEAASLGHDAALPQLADIASELSYRLSRLGRRSEAVQFAEHGELIHRRLTALDPATYRPLLARSLNNLGNRLSDLGHRQQALTVAEEAVNHYRQLAATDPDAFLANLASALNNLGNRLSDLGRRQQALTVAEEAVNHYRQLAATGREASLPDLAASLNNLSNKLSALRRHQQALATTEEAVAIRRRLATTNPADFLPDLATSLNNLSNMLSNLGQHEQALAAAEEAVNTYRQLADANPDAFLPYLASALNNFGSTLVDLGQIEQALLAAEEAVSTYRQLAAIDPEAFLPDLASSLTNLGSTLSIGGQLERAVTAAEEAASLHRSLAATSPDAFLPNLAITLSNLGRMLSTLGRHHQALSTTEEAVTIRRRLAAANSDAFTPDLARGLWTAAKVRLTAQTEPEQALAYAQEAVQLYLDLAPQLPEVYGPFLVVALTTQAELLEASGRTEEAAVIRRLFTSDDDQS